jgi:hypothetical protein
MIPSWRKRKALERKRRDQGLPIIAEPYRDDGYLAYCPNCGHRLDRVGHRFACGDDDFLDEIVEERAAKSPSFLRMVEDGDGEIVVSDDCPLSDDELRSMNRGGGRFRGGGEPPSDS